jgi:hypothetical protein
MRRLLGLSVLLVLTVPVLTAATAAKHKIRLLPEVTVQGTVIPGKITPGGDCPFPYWLTLETPDQPPTPTLGLETGPGGPDLAPFLNKQVVVTGQPGYCYGIEITLPIFHVKSIRSQAPAPTRAVAPPPPSATAPPPSSTRIKIGSLFNVEAGGCQDRAGTFSTTATGRLDTSKGGQGGGPAGFDFEATGNGSHGIRNISVSGNTVSFSLHAEGGGSNQNVPFAGTKCVNPTGANSAVQVYAWVFQQ